MEILPRDEGATGLPEAKLCTEQEAIFAQWYAETRSLVGAYRFAYNISNASNYRSVWSAAARVAERPHVAKRIAENVERLTANGVIRAISILQDLADIIETDINEIVRHTIHACRHCNGRDYAYQWHDASEFAREMDRYTAQQRRLREGTRIPKAEALINLPSASGGFGYDHTASPNPTCPHCLGQGYGEVTLADTTKLSPKALKSIKSISKDHHGIVKYELYDKNEARDMALKILGAYKSDGKGLPLGGQAPLDGISTLEASDPRAAADAYVRMLSAPPKG